MGTTERKARQKEKLRTRILEAALGLATAEGWRAVTIRALAARVEYSVPTVYGCFRSKEDLLRAIVQDGFARLGKALRKAVKGRKEPRQDLLAAAEAYWKFAFKHTACYTLLFNMEGVHCPLPESDPSVLSAFEPVRQLIAALPGGKKSGDESLTGWWALVHGYVALAFSDRLAGGKKELAPRLSKSMERFVYAL